MKELLIWWGGEFPLHAFHQTENKQDVFPTLESYQLFFFLHKQV